MWKPSSRARWVVLAAASLIAAPLVAGALLAGATAGDETELAAADTEPAPLLRPEAEWSEEERALNARLEELVADPGFQQATTEWGRDFYFTRGAYSGGRGWRRASWATDYPKADRQFLFILNRLLTLLDAHEWENPIHLADPELRRYPFLYMLEVGSMDLTPPEVEGLRNYLLAGGFLVIDDFWGERAWYNLEYNLGLVLPDRKIEPVPLDHVIFHQFYDIERILTVPSINNARYGQYEECYGPCEPRVYGIFDDKGELMVVINHNTDLGDAWEWSENPYYPIDRSTYAYELAINYIIYGLSH